MPYKIRTINIRTNFIINIICYTFMIFRIIVKIVIVSVIIGLICFYNRKEFKAAIDIVRSKKK